MAVSRNGPVSAAESLTSEKALYLVIGNWECHPVIRVCRLWNNDRATELSTLSIAYIIHLYTQRVLRAAEVARIVHEYTV
jgi:hypothetical protein